jgi:hypothetical protein
MSHAAIESNTQVRQRFAFNCLLLSNKIVALQDRNDQLSRKLIDLSDRNKAFLVKCHAAYDRPLSSLNQDPHETHVKTN